ncbi:UNVERIFIED_CONTAM: hypothetical protein FKN15_070005 [Acipenser sinensis]
MACSFDVRPRRNTQYCKFFTFEQYKKILSFTSLHPGLALSIAGLGAGLTEAVVVNPFEVVKVSLQANRNAFAEDPTLEFLRKFGIGLASGTISSCVNIPFDVAKSRIQGPQPVSISAFVLSLMGLPWNSLHRLQLDPTLEFLRKFGIGLASGTISSCVNIPFDVAKSRIQGPQPVLGEIKYRTCFQTMAVIYREEG